MNDFIKRRGSFEKNMMSFYIIFGIIGIQQCGSLKVMQRQYGYQMDYELVTLTDRNSSQSTRSEIGCASICSKDPDCFTFLFEVSTNMCQTSSRAMFGGLVPKIYCPNGRGYKVYKEARLELCLRLIQTTVSQSAAKGDCVISGGHLILVDNVAKHRFLQKLLLSMSSGTLWIDGEDKVGNNVFMDSKGTNISYFGWKSGEPSSSGEQCLMICNPSFLICDWYCSSTRGYICEID